MRGPRRLHLCSRLGRFQIGKMNTQREQERARVLEIALEHVADEPRHAPQRELLRIILDRHHPRLSPAIDQDMVRFDIQRCIKVQNLVADQFAGVISDVPVIVLLVQHFGQPRNERTGIHVPCRQVRPGESGLRAPAKLDKAASPLFIHPARQGYGHEYPEVPDKIRRVVKQGCARSGKQVFHAAAGQYPVDAA